MTYSEKYVKERVCINCHFSILDTYSSADTSKIWLKCKTCGYSCVDPRKKTDAQLEMNRIL
jgi:hypothetical protein